MELFFYAQKSTVKAMILTSYATFPTCCALSIGNKYWKWYDVVKKIVG